MASYNENPFAGDSENPFAVSYYDRKTFLFRDSLTVRVFWDRVTKLVKNFSCVFQDPSVASHTSNAARGLEDFNPFAEQNTSQASGAAKVLHIFVFISRL